MINPKNMVRDRKKTLIDYVLIVVLLVVSALPLHSIISSYVFGDQVHYRILYNSFSYTYSLKDIFSVAQGVVSSSEIISPVVLWFGSYLGVDKDVYITFLNLVLMGSFVVFLRRSNVSWLVVLLCLTNFYLIVLYTGAERLKIGYIFILFAALSTGKVRVLMLALTILSHFQMIIMVVALVAYFNSHVIYSSVIDFFLRFKLRLRHVIIVIGFLVSMGALLSSPRIVEGITIKGTAYFSTNGISFGDLLRFLVMLSCFILSKRLKVKFNTFLFAFFFFCSIAVLGGERVNMIFFTSILGILILERRLSVGALYNWPFLLLMVYFSFSSIDFVRKIYSYGNGFYGI